MNKVEIQSFLHLYKKCFCTAAVLCALVCSGTEARATVTIKDRVKVALVGEDVNLEFRLAVSANQSNFDLVCYGLHRQVIQRWKIPATVAAYTYNRKMKVTAINSLMSGDYSCEFNETSKVFWTLLVRDGCYKEPFTFSGFRGLTILGVFTTGLLLFNVVGSIYVFRGSQDQFAVSNDSSQKSRSGEQKEDEKEGEDSKLVAVAAASASVYASLDTRPRSIYDVLDPAAAKPETSQKKAKRKSAEKKDSIEKTTEEDGVLECVYENF